MINFGSGSLYIMHQDGAQLPLGALTDVECTTDANDISEAVVSLSNLEASFTMTTRMFKNAMLIITGVKDAVMDCCPNKRVVHLALYHKKARTRKKNLNRAIKILERLA